MLRLLIRRSLVRAQVGEPSNTKKPAEMRAFSICGPRLPITPRPVLNALQQNLHPGFISL